MEILTQRINTISINLIQDLDEGIDEISSFVSSLPKLKRIINELGYKNKFTKKEKLFWNEIFDSFIEEDKPEGVTNVSSDKTYVED